MKYVLFLAFTLMLYSSAWSSMSNREKRKKGITRYYIPKEASKKYKYAIGLSSGIVKFYGDVQKNGYNAPLFISFGYRPVRFLELKANVGFFTLSGDDQDAPNIYMKARNLQFKSFCQEATLGIALYPWDKYKNSVTPYLSLGGGLLHFNPKASLDGKWYELQPLGTEGQGIDGRSYYSRNTRVLLFGAGCLFNVSKRISIGLEANIRKTNSDYIDDVSTVYFDKARLNEKHGKESSLLSDPSYLSDVVLPDNGTYVDANGNTTYSIYGTEGNQRGDIKGRKDGYGMLLISMQYRF